MASIKLQGDTSGELTISAPAVAGTNTLTLPASTGTLLTTTGDGSQLTNLPVVGIGQTWTDVTSSRSANTVYTNSTGRPIMVSVSLEIVVGAATVNWFYVGSVIVAQVQNTSAELATTTSFIVPNGATYKHQYQSVAPTIRNWSELS